MKIQSLIICLTLSATAWAANPEEKFDPKKIDQIIHKVYRESLEQKMVDYINLAKKHKNAADFFTEAIHLPIEASKQLRDLLKDAPVPKIISVSNGLKFTSGDQSFTIEFTDTLGEIKVDGVKAVLPPGKTLRQWAEEQSKQAFYPPLLMDSLLPKAEASAWTALAKLTWGGIKGAAMGAVGGTAAGVMVGVSAGCIYGIHARPSHRTIGDGCEQGATNGVAVMIAGASGVTYGGLGAWFGVDQASWNLDYYERYAMKEAGEVFRKNLWRAVKFGGIAGTIALLAHGVNELSFMNGAIIKCSSNGGYKVTGLDNGAQKLLYNSDYGGISLGWGEMKDTADLEKNLKQRFPQTSEEQRKIVSEQIWKEHLDMRETCTKNPSKEYRVRDTDSKKINDPGPAEGKK